MTFYRYLQNNSGGVFEIDDNVAMITYIEADSAEEANEKALQIGIYFDGCEKGFDCECCGDRWYEADEHDKNEKPECNSLVHYKDGTKKKIKEEE